MNKSETTLKRPGSYWEESAQPLVSLVFILPMLIAYEGGLLLIESKTLHRNGIEEWLRHLLESIGFGQYFLLPLLTCGILLGWHHMTNRPWRFSWRIPPIMLVESAILGGLLFMVPYLLQPSLLNGMLGFASVSDEVSSKLAGRIVGFLGTGLYEELLFRLMLFPVIRGVLRMAGAPERASLITAMIITSLIFSGAHYELFTGRGDPFAWNTFVPRFLLGIFFNFLYVSRGFGITAGSHAAYDIYIAVLVSQA